MGLEQSWGRDCARLKAVWAQYGVYQTTDCCGAPCAQGWCRQSSCSRCLS